MRADTGAEDARRSISATEQFTQPAYAQASEGAEVARALAVKLGCRRVGLIGCLRKPIIRGLRPQLEVVGIDAEPLIARARELEPQGKWLAWSWGEGFGSESRALLAGSLLVVDGRPLLEDDDFIVQLRELLPGVPAAVVIDPDGGWGLEMMKPLVSAAEAGGLCIAHRSLVRAPGRRVARRESPLMVVSDGHDSRVAHSLAAGASGLALDPAVDLQAELDRPARVCVASYEVAGPTRNGGIGTANSSLALALGRAGHDVTLLFTGFPGADGPVDEPTWQRRYARQNVHFKVLSRDSASDVKAPHANVRRAYEFYAWLRERALDECFDVVHFPECQGHGYYAVLARHQGIAFGDTLFVAGVHSSTRWCGEANRELPRSIDALVDEHLERLSVELADAVISPSAYMLDYMQERGWKLPERRFVQQYILPPTARVRPGIPPRRRDRAVEEIVFFGRLEVRKGIETFCDALDLAAQAGAPSGIRITFLGRPEHVLGEPAVDYVARRAKRWPWTYEVLGNLDQQQAMAHLRHGSCLAVMPSTVDNSPNTVSETLSLRIPLIASRSGGTGELIDSLELPDVTFPGLETSEGLPPIPAHLPAPEMSAGALAERILAALRSPVVPRFAIDHDANEEFHVAWNVGAVVASVRQRRNAAGHRHAGEEDLPTVTVGLLHREQGDELIDTLTALSAQQDQLLDVVVVDDASSSELSERALARAEELCGQHGWRLIRREHRHAGAARQQMVDQGRGELFVFLRASESLVPRALAMVREVARQTGAEAFSWPATDPHRQYGPEASSSNGASALGSPVIVPIAGPALAGLLYPAFSSGPYAIRRAALERLRGFAVDARGLDADQDLLNRALLQGCSIEVIPEPLAIVRQADPWASLRSALTIELGENPLDREQALRVARPFAAMAPAPLVDLPGLQLTIQSKTPRERLRAIDAYKQLDEQRHQQSEYIAYLEGEHHQLSGTVISLREAGERAPHRRVRRVLGRIKRRLLASLR